MVRIHPGAQVKYIELFKETISRQQDKIHNYSSNLSYT